MNSNKAIILKISKLRELKLDKETLISLQAKLRDPETLNSIAAKAKSVIESKKGSWTISIVTASLIAVTTIPPLLKSLTDTQGIISKYRVELADMPTLLEGVNSERKRYADLEKNEIQQDKYLLNSGKLLVLPELIRQAAAPHQIKLVSFRPTADEQDNQFFDAAEEPTDEFIDDQFVNDDFSNDENLDPLYDQMNDSFEVDDPLESTINPEAKKKELLPLNYSIQLEGDYLRLLSFLKDIQGYQSLLGIQSAEFTAASSTSMDPTATNSSSPGSVLLNMVIQIPTIKE